MATILSIHNGTNYNTINTTKDIWLTGLQTVLQPIDVDDNDKGIISDDIMPYVYTINLSIICGVCSLFGIVTNILNIVVFARMGFRESINVSLSGLAVSDCCSLIALLWVSICFNPFFLYSDLPVLTSDLQHYPGGWTHVVFTRITSFVTAFITLERCLCIVFPLRIKRMMTPRRAAIVNVGIYCFVLGSMLADYSVFYFDCKWVPSRNRTLFGSIYRSHRDSVVDVSFYIQMVYPVLAFTSVVICTVVFVWRLNQRTEWLQSASASTSQEKKSFVRDQHVIKMVVCVAVIFIISYIPSVILFTVLSSVPDTDPGEKNRNLFDLVYSIACPLEAINSSVNIFVYYKMMSKYKAMFHSLRFGCNDPNIGRVQTNNLQ